MACYAIGWGITQDEINEYEHLRFAEGESDVGVIVSFNSEAESVNDSLLIPARTKTLAINPLNWKTDVTTAEYPPVLTSFDDVVYHLYDYQFFYRNLQENVSARVSNYVELNS